MRAPAGRSHAPLSSPPHLLAPLAATLHPRPTTSPCLPVPFPPCSQDAAQSAVDSMVGLLQGRRQLQQRSQKGHELMQQQHEQQGAQEHQGRQGEQSEEITTLPGPLRGSNPVMGMDLPDKVVGGKGAGGEVVPATAAAAATTTTATETAAAAAGAEGMAALTSPTSPHTASTIALASSSSSLSLSIFETIADGHPCRPLDGKGGQPSESVASRLVPSHSLSPHPDSPHPRSSFSLCSLLV